MEGNGELPTAIVYRTNIHYPLKKNPLELGNLQKLITYYNSSNRIGVLKLIMLLINGAK